MFVYELNGCGFKSRCSHLKSSCSETFRNEKCGIFWAKKLMERWYLLITEKFLFFTFRWWEIWSFLGQEVDGKDYIYWLQKSSCFKLCDDDKYGLFLSQEVDGKDYFYCLQKTFPWWEIWSFFNQKMDGKMIFTGYREVIILNFSVMGNAIFFLAKKLMERWYLLGLF